MLVETLYRSRELGTLARGEIEAHDRRRITMKDSRSTRLSRREAINLLGVGAGLGLVTALRQEAGLAAASGQPAATKVIFPKGAIIRTVLKDVSPEALGTGATLFHDHVSLSSRRYAPPPKTPVWPQWLENVDTVV